MHLKDALLICNQRSARIVNKSCSSKKFASIASICCPSVTLWLQRFAVYAIVYAIAHSVACVSLAVAYKVAYAVAYAVAFAVAYAVACVVA